jgi:hypothetical protein
MMMTTNGPHQRFRFAVLWLMSGGLLGATLGAVAAEPPKADCTPLALPGMKLTWVTPDVVHNGMPLQVRRFDSTDNVQTILARYRLEWKASAQSPRDAIEYPLDKWLVIAKLRDKCFYTAQVRSNGAGGSTGMLGASPTPDSTQARILGKDFPMMSGSLVRTDITHRDPGKEARTILLQNQFSTTANANFYRRKITEDGWNITGDHLIPYQGGQGSSYAMTFKRGFNETSMAITRSKDGTSVLVNLVDKP